MPGAATDLKNTLDYISDKAAELMRAALLQRGQSAAFISKPLVFAMRALGTKAAGLEFLHKRCRWGSSTLISNDDDGIIEGYTQYIKEAAEKSDKVELYVSDNYVQVKFGTKSGVCACLCWRGRRSSWQRQLQFA